MAGRPRKLAIVPWANRSVAPRPCGQCSPQLNRRHLAGDQLPHCRDNSRPVGFGDEVQQGPTDYLLVREPEQFGEVRVHIAQAHVVLDDEDARHALLGEGPELGFILADLLRDELTVGNVDEAASYCVPMRGRQLHKPDFADSILPFRGADPAFENGFRARDGAPAVFEKGSLDGLSVRLVWRIEMAKPKSRELIATAFEQLLSLSVRFGYPIPVKIVHNDRVGCLFEQQTEARLPQALVFIKPPPLGDVSQRGQPDMGVFNEKASKGNLCPEEASILGPAMPLE